MNDLVKDLRNPKTEGNCWRCFSAADKIESLQAEVERLREVQHRISQWCRAYPRTVFIEPTKEQWRIANETLDAHKGDNCPSLTAISGSNMRHVVEGIQKIIDGNED